MSRQLQPIFASGDQRKFAAFLEPEAEELVAGLGLQGGKRVLDVACGDGNVAIAAAHRGALVTGVDVPRAGWSSPVSAPAQARGKRVWLWRGVAS